MDKQPDSRPRPLRIANAIALAVAAVIDLVLIFGVSLPAETKALASAAIIAVGQVFATLIAEQYVTPVSDPRDNKGKRLTPPGERSGEY